MKRTIVFITLLVAFLALAGTALAQGGYDLSWFSVDGGGGTFSTGGSYSLGGTSGQADAGSLSGGSYSLLGGFWGAASSAAPTSTPTPTPTASAPAAAAGGDDGEAEPAAPAEPAALPMEADEILLSPGGGTVSDETLGVWLLVPPGAVPTSGIRVIQRPLPAGMSPATGAGFHFFGRGVEVIARDATGNPLTDFSAHPLTLCFSYTDADLAQAGGDPSNLEIVTVNQANGFSIEVRNRRVDTAARTICVDLIHLSPFALLAREPVELPATGAPVSPLWGMALLAVLAVMLTLWAWRAWRRAT